MESVAIPTLPREDRDVTSTQLPLAQHRCMMPLLKWRRTIGATTNREVEQTDLGAHGVDLGSHDSSLKLPEDVRHVRTEFGATPKNIAVRHANAQGERRTKLIRIYDYAAGDLLHKTSDPREIARNLITMTSDGVRDLRVEWIFRPDPEIIKQEK